MKNVEVNGFKEEFLIKDKNEIDFMNTIAEQIHIASGKIEKEALLRKIIKCIKSTIDVNEILHILVHETAKIVGSMRAFYTEYDKNQGIFLIPDEKMEYRASSTVRSYKELGCKDFETAGYKFFIDFAKNMSETLFINNVDEFIKEFNLENTIEAANLKKHNIKSDIMFTLTYDNELMGAFAFEFDKPNAYTDEDIEFIKTIVDHSTVAINQAQLHKKEQQALEIESLLVKITDNISNIIDLNHIKKHLVNDIGKFLKTDRCIIHQTDQKTGLFKTIDEFSEYKTSDNLISYIGQNLEYPRFKYFKDLYINRKELIAPNWPEFLENIESIDKETKNWLKTYDIKSNYAFLVLFQDKLLAVLHLTYTKNYKFLSENELKTISFLCKQFGIALKQAQICEEENTSLNDIILINKNLSKNIGFNCAITYSVLSNKYNYNKDKDNLTKDGFNITTLEKIQTSTFLNIIEQKSSIQKLSELGLIECNKLYKNELYFKIIDDEGIIKYYLTEYENDKKTKNDLAEFDSSNAFYEIPELYKIFIEFFSEESVNAVIYFVEKSGQINKVENSKMSRLYFSVICSTFNDFMINYNLDLNRIKNILDKLLCAKTKQNNNIINFGVTDEVLVYRLKRILFFKLQESKQLTTDFYSNPEWKLLNNLINNDDQE